MHQHKFITSPIFYVNGSPHLGHLYTSFAVDVLARWEKLLGNQVFLCTGTDEHGQKVAAAAEKLGRSPKEFVDEAHLPFKEMLIRMGVEYNVFIRTTDAMHKQTASYVWEKLAGMTYESHYEGWYSKTDEAYYKDDEIAEGKSIETGSTVERMKESCIFFKLSEMKSRLIKFYEDNPSVIQPKSKYSEVMGLLKADLPDLAISRSRFDWGIPVPGLPGHVMYVWIDALTNYLTALNYPRNKDYLKYWNNSVHVIGKDILKFHAIYWPAFLLAIDLPPPARIFAHGWWNVDGQKMSKSIGNVIDPFELLEKYHPDCLRYFMFSEVYFGNDGNFSQEALHGIINVHLANELGNLVQRVCMLCYNKYGRTIECELTEQNLGLDILTTWDKARDISIECMDRQDISGYVNSCRAAVIATNKYIDQVKPWVAQNPMEILGVLCLCIQRICLMYSPLLPLKTKEMASLIGLNSLELNQENWSKHGSYPLKKPQPIFLRVEND